MKARMVALAGLLAVVGCADKSYHGQRYAEGHVQGFDAYHHYLPHDHTAHYYTQNMGRGPLYTPGHNRKDGYHQKNRVAENARAIDIRDGIPMRIHPGNRSVYLKNAPDSDIGSQTLLQKHVSALAYQLVSSVHGLNTGSGIAVSGFVEQDDYRSQDSFSRFLSETMMFQLNQYGLKVVDFKALPYIRITPQGDISTSRDYRELTSNIGASYLLHGTITKTSGGRMVNARMIRMGDNTMVASAQQFVPEYLASSTPQLRGPALPARPIDRSRYAK
ncbi:FlgO family outer membrane protein [Oceanimonas smirnovii]|uniref:FlgO family outer membrane protein n=1 Tax=Oceanimonas smirnovii TaxID=264574 RepID=UPI00377052F2